MLWGLAGSLASLKAVAALQLLDLRVLAARAAGRSRNRARGRPGVQDRARARRRASNLRTRLRRPRFRPGAICAVTWLALRSECSAVRTVPTPDGASARAPIVGMLPAVAGGLEQLTLAQGQAHLTCLGVEPVLAPAALGTSVAASRQAGAVQAGHRVCRERERGTRAGEAWARAGSGRRRGNRP
jgi:hypothetical protein